MTHPVQNDIVSSVCTCRAVFASVVTEVRIGGKLLDSGGVGIAEVSSPVLSVGMKLIGPSVHSVFCSLYLNLISLTHSQLTCIHTHTHTQFRDNTQTKHCKIHRGYSAVHINHMLANAHST